MNSLVGQSLGRYHILEQHGEGGMAVVYKAFDTRLERDVAIKIIRSEAFPPEQLEQVLKRFEREAKALARLSHPNIVKVLDYGEHNGAPYLVLEYLPGGTLKGHMGRALPWQEALHLLLPVARALAYAHQQGIIHRDVKPANILMTQSGEPMLTDFGIAKILQAGDGQTLTGSGVGIGTPDYMAPEQGMGGKIDARVDVYALGVVFYELVTGRKPYIADTPMAVLLKHITDPLPRPSEFALDLPVFVENVLLKALAKSPEDRYASMEQMAAAFEKLLTNATLQFPRAVETPPLIASSEPKTDSPTTASPQTAIPVELPTVMAPTQAEPPSSQEIPTKREKAPRRDWLWLRLGIIVISLLALGGWAASRILPAFFIQPTPTLNLSDLPGLFLQPCGAGNREICLTEPNGQILKQLRLPLPESYGQISGLAWGPDGKWIALSAWRDLNGYESDLFVYHLENGQLQRLTERDNNIMPAWSPDGRWIAYHSAGRAMLISPDGSNRKHISAGYDQQVIATSLAWSPDSAWLAWLVREADQIQRLRGLRIYSMRAQSLAFIQFATDETIEKGYELYWDPYGRYLYLTISDGETQRFDMTCLQTSCQGIKPEAVTGIVSQKWSQRYYPQWSVSTGDITIPAPIAISSPTPIPKSDITITFWHAYGTGSAEEIALSRIITQTARELPQYRIDVIQVPFNDIFNKYRVEVAAGGGPDIFIAPNDSLGEDARAGLIADITTLADDWLGNYTPLAVDGMTYQGRLYGIPESLKAVAFWYNKDLLPRPPTRTDELKRLMQSGTPVAISFGCYHHYGFFGAFGGKIFDKNWRIIADQGGVTEAMRYLNDLYQISKARGWPRIDSESLAPFAEGRVAAITNGNWMMGDYRRALGNKLAVAPLPAGPGGPASPLLGVDGIYFNPNSPNHAAALEVALLLTSQSAQTIMMVEAGHVPARLDVEISDPLIRGLVEAFKTATVRPQVPQLGLYWSNFCGTDEVFEKGVPPAEWVKQATANANK